MFEFLHNWWSIIVAFVGLVVWAVRLEMKVNRNSDYDKIMKENIRDLEARWTQQRVEDIADANRAWDKLDVKLDTLQSDVKELLKRSL